MAQACEGAMLSPAEVDESRVADATMHVKRRGKAAIPQHVRDSCQPSVHSGTALVETEVTRRGEITRGDNYQSDPARHTGNLSAAPKRLR